MKLNNFKIDNLKPKESLYKKADSNNLFLHVYPSGKKVFVIRYFFPQHPKKVEKSKVIGSYPSLSLSEARKVKDKWVQWSNNGIDPKLEDRKTRLGTGNSFYKISQVWLEQNKETWEYKTYKKKVSHLRDHIYPYLKDTDITKIERSDISLVIKECEGKGLRDVPKRVLSWIRSILDLAVDLGIVQYNVSIGLERTLKKHKVKHRDSVKIEEISPLLNQINAYEGDVVVKYALKILVLTFVRSKELRTAQWKDINFEKRIWTIPSHLMKMRKEHFVPLSKNTLKLIRELRNISGNGNYLFPSRRSREGFMGENTLNHAFWKMGFKEKISPHGLRATASSALKEAGFSHKAVELQLAHVDRNTTSSSYDYWAEYKEARFKMMEWYSEEIILRGLKIDE